MTGLTCRVIPSVLLTDVAADVHCVVPGTAVDVMT